VIRRTPRETVMLEALEWVNSTRHSDSCPALWGHPCIDLCALFHSERALATVNALDDAEMAARGPGSAGGEVVAP
jgi:hypothetical protein